ncbi:MAG: FAD:protein FMN transferase [Muribaculaceae bacterium]|nr:FAD:protein FMN transferase [Muribaculaceae bacterium]
MANRNLTKRSFIVIMLALVIAIVALHFARDRKRFWADEGMVWTTEYHITYETRSHLNDSIQATLAAIDASASPYNVSSLISRINSNSTQLTDSIFRRLYRASVSINKASQGAFDPTVMPLVNAWGFGYKSGNLPGKAQIDSLLQFVGIGKTHLDGDRLVKQDARTQFDFSSIAKGLACDEVGRMLQRNGALNFLVEIGGEVTARGVNPRGGKWHISVDMPTDQDTAVSHQAALVIAIGNEAVATSGNYRKFKMVEGRKVSHIIDPITGYSSTSSLLSVTIIAPDCMTADAWATACMVMGTDKVQLLMKSRTDLGVMTISTDDQGNYIVWSNKAFADHVVSQ